MRYLLDTDWVVSFLKGTVQLVVTGSESVSERRLAPGSYVCFWN